MSKAEKCRPSQMSIRILLLLLQYPGQYNKTQIAEKVGISRYRIKKYLDAYKKEDLEVDINQNTGKCSILIGNRHKELKNILAMSYDDIDAIHSALTAFKSSKAAYLKKKLENLYNFQKLGLRSLRKPHLDKIDKLEYSKRVKKRVILKNYRSNSNEIKDRTVECIEVHTDIGTLQVYDIDRKDVRHFKLDRFDRVELLDEEPWEIDTSLKQRKETDDFRIANNDQITVHLRLSVKAYNLLIDAFPKVSGHVLPADQKGFFNYQAKVNKDYLGLAPFILANAEQVEIIEPSELRDHIISLAYEAISNVRNSHM